jgi:hypothetical protein
VPVRDRLIRQSVPGEDELREKLKAELESPQATGEPDIIVERPNASTTHLFVVWSAWEPLEQVVRSRIILDAYSEARGEGEALKVTVAMGLTPEEASRLGLE